ncbi:MAG: hypothetical protein ACUVSX_02475 [Aggregatilineales bacterium]
MPDQFSPNYPDILGYITGGDRCNIGVAQLALAVRPRVVRAGRAFEAVLLVQNAADVDVDVTAVLHVPEADARRQKRRFVSKKSRLVVGLRPAETGYVVLPVSCLPDTAVGDDYRLAVEVAVKPLQRPARIRSAEGGGSFEVESLRPEIRQQLDELRNLRFSNAKRFGLRDVLEAPFSVMPGKVGQIVDFSAGWTSLWTMADLTDTRALLAHFGTLFLEQVLPHLQHAHAYALLLAATSARFAAAGYPLRALEAAYIAKALARVLDMAMPQDNVFDYMANSAYNVALTIRQLQAGESAEPVLPRWAVHMLRAVSQNAQVAARPAAALAQAMYTDLLQDAVVYGFDVIKTATGKAMGSDKEIAQYAERMAAMLETNTGMDLAHAYMPLVLAGIVLYDRVVLPDEDVAEQLRAMGDVLDEREPERTAANNLVFALARQLINRSLQKYGIQI